MNALRTLLMVACTSGVLATNAAMAVTVAGNRGAVAPKDIPRGATSASGTTPSLDLIDGTITAVNKGKRTITVSGMTVAWHPTQLRVYKGGSRASEHDLIPGTHVRFALDGGTPGQRTIVLVYLDRAR
jgi:hypothetical protein